MTLRTRLMRVAIPLTALGLVSGVAGGAGATTAAAPKLPPATLNGSGSTLTNQFIEANIAAFKKEQPSVTVNYSAVGSGAGRTAFASQVVQYAVKFCVVPDESERTAMVIAWLGRPLLPSAAIAGSFQLVILSEKILASVGPDSLIPEWPERL